MELVESATLENNYLKLKGNTYTYEYTLDITKLASEVYIAYIEATNSNFRPIKQIKKFAVIK